MMITRIVSWTLRKVGLGSYASLKDMTNAFQCTENVYRNTAVEKLYLPQHCQRMQQRLAWAAVRLDGYDGTIYALPTKGNQIGSCEGPTLFCLPYADSLIDWRLESRDLAPTLILESPGGKVSDGGLQVYADDVFERRAVVSGEAEEAINLIRESNVAFDESMGRR